MQLYSLTKRQNCLTAKECFHFLGLQKKFELNVKLGLKNVFGFPSFDTAM